MTERETCRRGAARLTINFRHCNSPQSCALTSELSPQWHHWLTGVVQRGVLCLVSVDLPPVRSRLGSPRPPYVSARETSGGAKSQCIIKGTKAACTS